MDSGNTSGSIQSSNGGDEEYDSRAAATAASDSIFFTNNPQNDVVHHHQTQSQSQSQSSSLLFDPLSKLFDRNPNFDFNNNMVWGAKPLRSDPNHSDLVLPAPISPSANLLGPTPTPLPYLQQPIHITNNPTSSPADMSNEPGSSARNPKKRLRASRRAPTTVLTTDTTNFRAMVQEFTGIPAPPFASSTFPMTRFDLFGSESSLRSGHSHIAASSSSTNSLSLTTTAPSPYNLLRPFTQKVQQTTLFAANASCDSNSIKYSNLLSHNPALSFNSLLQPSLKIADSPALQDHHTTTSFGLGHVSQLNPNPVLQGLVATTTTAESANWSRTNTGVGILASNDNNIAGNDNRSSMADEGFLRAINGASEHSERQQIVSNGKLNSTSTATGFSNNKATENIAARSEGMVESWICSSD